MIDCLRTRVRKQPIIALYFESENGLKFCNLEAWFNCLRGVLRLLVTVSVLWLFLTVPWVGLQCVIVVYPDHTHFLKISEA